MSKKRSVNLLVDSDLLDEATRLEVDISEALERQLRRIVRSEQKERWRDENRDAIDSINGFIDNHDLIASRLRYRSDNG